MIDLYFYLTASIGVILFGISKGGFAGPIAILAIPIMALNMSPISAAAILLPVLLVMDVVAMYIYWKKWDLKNIKIIIPISIIGIIVGTFTFSLVSDDGIDGIVITLGNSLKKLIIEGTSVYCQSGVMLGKFVKECISRSLSGVESLIGVPGTVGGALIMSAGAFGSEISNYLKKVTVMTMSGQLKSYKC